MNVFWHELRAYRKATIIWAAGIVLLLAASMAKFTTLTSGGIDIEKMLAGFPPTIMAIFGLNGLNVTTVAGYFGILFLYVAIMLAIHAGLLGADIIAKEEQDKAAEFLYVKPRSRRRIVTGKLLAAFTLIVLLNVVTFAASCGLATRYVALPTVLRELACFNVAYVVIQVLFMAVGMVAAASRWSTYAGRVVASLVMVTYLLYVVATMQPALGGIGHISPLVQFKPSTIIDTGMLPLGWVVGDTLLGVVCIMLAYLLYCRRDLRM